MIAGTIRTFLTILLLLATAATRVVDAKVSLSGNEFSSSMYRVDGRYLQGGGNAVQAFLTEIPKETHSSGSNGSRYIPYPPGTAVQYHDQDGTWMDGKIVKYNSDTRTYTIQWDEDNVNEDFSDLSKIDQLVLNAVKKSATAEDEDVSGSASKVSSPKDFDFNYTYTYDDLTEYEPWSIGTETLLEFADGYYEGRITSFLMSQDKKNATYIVTWSDGTSDTFSNELEWMDLMVFNAKNYEPWSKGTPTYGYPNPNAHGAVSEDSYLSGNITSFQGGVYTITWSDGEAVAYSDFDVVDELVYNAAMHFDPDQLNDYEPWPIKTPVSWDFDDGWWDGTITGFKDGTYEVTWSDGTKKEYSNLEKIDQMVAFRAGEGFLGDDNSNRDDTNGDDFYSKNGYYPIGTLVYAEFKDGWWAGYVDAYDDEYFVIKWSDDSSDSFLPGPDMDSMVDNAKFIASDFELYPEGTMVADVFNGDWYYGTVEYSSNGIYEVLWEDGERTIQVAGATFDQMVDNAYSSGLGIFGTLAIFIAIGGVVGITFYVAHKSKKKSRLNEITEQVQENELDLAEEIGRKGQYSDEPTEGNNDLHVV
mmetsp:Transcript_76/g.179  ORF Transcript_76/g.179 Transcript_76/m.179 type:complete len:587 (-) Transcript_76:334-2094(-)